MKRYFLLLCFFFLFGSCTTTHMIRPGHAPDLTCSPDKATLVVIRNTTFDDNYVFWIYLDRNLIGETTAKTYFITSVTPGPHFVVVLAENKSVSYFDFKQGKTYFLAEWGMIGVWRSRTAGLYPMTPEEAKKAMKECTYLQYDSNTGEELMDLKLYQQAINEYNRDIKRTPEAFKDVLNYDGVVLKQK